MCAFPAKGGSRRCGPVGLRSKKNASKKEAFSEESRVSILPIEDCTEVERNAIESKCLRGPSDMRRSVLRYTSLAGPELPAPPRVV